MNLIILQLSHADSFDIFDKASLSFNQSQIGLRPFHKINIGLWWLSKGKAPVAQEVNFPSKLYSESLLGK